MKAIFFIAKRYMVAKSSQNVINIINRITALVVVIGCMALFVVLAGFAGLKTFTLSFSTLFDPDLKIIPKVGKTISPSQAQLAELEKMTEIAHFSRVIEEQVFLNHKQKNHIAQIKGVDENYSSVCDVDSILVLGSWSLNPQEVVVGATIFNSLGLGFSNASSPLQIVVPKSGKGSITTEAKPYREIFSLVSGVFQITEDLDKKFVFSSLADAQFILGLDSTQISGIEIKLKPEAQEREVVTKIETLFNGNVVVKNRIQLNDALYRMLNTENAAVYLIFILVLILALFNLGGAVIMLILDKKEDLRTLHALGMSPKQMRQIFFLQGTMVSVLGASVGIVLGTFIVLLQKKLELVMISPTLVYPVEIEFTNVVIVFSTIVILGISASWIASSRISKNNIQI